MKKFKERDIQKVFFPKHKGKIGKFIDMLALFPLLSLPVFSIVLKEDVYHQYKEAGKAYEVLFKKIRKHPFYTRNNKMETRAYVGIYLFSHFLLPEYPSKDEKKFILVTLAITLIDCIADTVADEYENRLVKDRFKTLLEAEKYLKEFEEHWLLAVDGELSQRATMHDKALHMILLSFQSVLKKLRKEKGGRGEDTILEELKEGIRYIFVSHFASLHLREREYQGFTGVNDNLAQFAGAISYYTVFYMTLLSKAQNVSFLRFIAKKNTMERARHIAIMVSELTYSINGYKSYPREFREGDFSSWVYPYSVQQGTISIREVREYIAHGLPQNRFEEIMVKIDNERVKKFLVHEVTKRLNSISSKSRGIFSDTYLDNLVTIMKMQIASGGREEHEQVKTFLHLMKS